MFRYIAQIILILVLFTGFESAFARENEINKKFTIESNSIEINIDVDFGEIKIIPSGKSSQLRVKVEYYTEYSEIELDYNERRNTLDIVADQEWFSDEDDYECSDCDNKRGVEITVELPYKPEIDLDVEIKAGETDFQLGGLSLRNFEFDNYAGEVDIDFDTPNRINMDTFNIDCKVGELDIYNLGNSHFTHARINSGIGELEVDFSGDILDDVTADIDLELGETYIIVPREIGTKMRISRFMFFNPDTHYSNFHKEGSYYYSEKFDDRDERLFLNISSGIGEINVMMK
ncbi:DUF4097 family beta strand repeat-containing protein [Candidatus Latescibacterota bacterium]